MHVLSSLRIAGLAASTLALAMPPALAQNAMAKLKNAEGKDVGIAALVQVTGGVLISLSVDGLPAGDHAFTFMRSAIDAPPLLQQEATSTRRIKSMA